MRLLDQLIARYEEDHHVVDSGPIHVVLGAAVANLYLPGAPVWLVVVGPPGCGKSTLLDLVTGLEAARTVSTFSPASLLSAAPDGTRGLLAEVPNPGLLLFSDLTTTLGQAAEPRGAALSMMREVYDGHVVRRVGTKGGRREWQGRLGLVGGVTELVYRVDMTSVGDRLIYYPMPQSASEDRHGAARRALDTLADERERRAARRQLATDLLTDLTPDPRALAPFTGDETTHLIGIADLAAVLRTRALRDASRGDLIELVPQPESPTRLAGQLGQFLRGMRAVGTPDDVAWQVVEQTGLGCIPPVRRSVARALSGSSWPKTTATLAARARLPRKTVRRHLQDLNALGIIDLVGDHPESWQGGEGLCEGWRAAFGSEVEDNDDTSADRPTVIAGGAHIVNLPLPGHCTACGAPPPRRGSFGIVGGCAHQDREEEEP